MKNSFPKHKKVKANSKRRELWLWGGMIVLIVFWSFISILLRAVITAVFYFIRALLIVIGALLVNPVALGFTALVIITSVFLVLYRKAKVKKNEGSKNNHKTTKTNFSADKSYYDVLEITKDFTKEELKTAYLKMVKKYHPDRVANMGPEFQELAEQKMRKINEAYEQLGGRS